MREALAYVHEAILEQFGPMIGRHIIAGKYSYEHRQSLEPLIAEAEAQANRIAYMDVLMQRPAKDAN
jgi:hypothetical protein